MRISNIYILAIAVVMTSASGSSKNSKSTERTTTVTDGMTAENRTNTSLLNQIRRLKGKTLQGGVPFFRKTPIQ